MSFIKRWLSKFRNVLVLIFVTGPKAVTGAIRNLIIASCWALIKCFEHPAKTQSSKLPDLCPTDDAKYVDDYIDALNEMLINRERTVREIAITSPYSGGKSSLLNTYIRKTPFLKFTSVSLASFKDLSQGVGIDSPEDNIATLNGANGSAIKVETPKQKENLSKIEKSIVQQLLYRTDSKKTPNSRFRRIFPRPVSNSHAFSMAACLVLFGAIIGSIIYLPNFSVNGTYESVLLSPNLHNLDLWIVSYILSLPLLILRDLYKTLSRHNISRFNPVKGELAFEQQKKDSIFNIYLDEIIYFFASQKTDVVVFEDLDRFENTEIFIKLKELNKLINDSKDVEQKVRFIYALRDDVFQGNDRTKFFDVIIPIIPIASKANSYPQLKELMQNAGLVDDVKDSFLRGVSVYVDDMRMLKNIVTEFGIYKNTLIRNLEHLDLTKLFAFIVYKNVYSDDFAKLHAGEGDLFQFFVDIVNVRATKEAKIETEIEKLNQRLLDSEQELTDSLEELNAGYVMKLLARLSPSNYGVYDINGHRLHTIQKQEVFDKLAADSSNISHRMSTSHGPQNSNFSFQKFLKDVSPNYDKRKQRVIDKAEDNNRIIFKRIEQLEEELSLLHELPITSLIKNVSRKEVFKKIDSKQLLILLLERGYIDQNYDEYISHFHEGHMTIMDMAFIRHVQSDGKADPLHEIDNFEEALKYFSDEDYRKATFFNYKLFDYILSGENRLPVFRYLEKYLAKSKDLTRIVKDGLDNLTNKDVWISSVINCVDNYWEKVISHQGATQKNKQVLLIDSINALPSNNWHGYLNSSISELSEFISESESIGLYLPNKEVDQERLFEAFTLLKVKFQSLRKVKSESDFLQQVLKRQLFEVNEDSLSLIAVRLFSLSDDESKDFSALKSIEDDSLSKALNDEIERVAARLAAGQLKVSKEEDFVWLLNNKEISPELRIDIIEKHSFVINDIRDIDNRDEFATHLVNSERLLPNWTNVEYMFENENFSDKLLKEYLNTNYKALTNEESSNLADKDITSYSHIILDDIIDTEAFGAYLSVFDYQYKVDDLKEVSMNKVLFLIENNRLIASVDTFNALSDIGLEASVAYMTKNFDSLIEGNELDASLSVDSQVFYEVLDTEKLTQKQQKTLIESRTDLIDGSREQEAFKNSFGYKEIIQGNDISDYEIPRLPFEVLQAMTLASSDEFKKVLFASQNQYLDDSEAVQLLKHADVDFAQAFTAKRSFKVEDNSINNLLATILKSRGLISSFKKRDASFLEMGKSSIEVFVKKSLTT